MVNPLYIRTDLNFLSCITDSFGIQTVPVKVYYSNGRFAISGAFSALSYDSLGNSLIIAFFQLCSYGLKEAIEKTEHAVVLKNEKRTFLFSFIFLDYTNSCSSMNSLNLQFQSTFIYIYKYFSVSYKLDTSLYTKKDKMRQMALNFSG